jgi:hypothetical protein
LLAFVFTDALAIAFVIFGVNAFVLFGLLLLFYAGVLL